MNKERVLAVADAIEALVVNGNPVPGLGFNMSGWVADPGEEACAEDHSRHMCSTTACIAGWTVALFDKVSAAEMHSMVGDHVALVGIESRATELLGLSVGQAHALFYAEGSGKLLEDVTPEEAIATLRDLAESEHIQWHLHCGGAEDTEDEEHGE
jgi:hypothetical protein